MIILNGNTLGERQKQLNNQVNNAATNKVDFHTVKEQDEISDIDKFFKIDLAAKYKNVEYILEILKCGDNLYIARALHKSIWLYDDDFKHVINDDYLSKNIFPSMSIKNRNKMLNSIAANLKNNDTRAVQFCAYCLKMKLDNIALKFIIRTPISFKLDVIMTENTKVFTLITGAEGNYVENFIGDSFDLAENYIKKLNWEKSKNVYMLRYMYSLSNEKYLNMLDTCDVDTISFGFGRRLSKHIIQNHKARVMKKPSLYAKVLHKDIIKKNCIVDEAKIFAVALLPDRPSNFFYSKYYSTNKFILDLIPAEGKFEFIKKIFGEKYKDEPFETSYEFYSNGFYEIMTIQERESWALQNITSHNEILGSGNDFLWYKFINFEKSFIDMRKDIMKTTDHNKRRDMLKVLLDSAKNDDDLTKLLDYFCERHRNEVSHVIDQFLCKLIEDHNVWRFGENCWNALEKIFYNIEVFDKAKYQSCCRDYRVVALMYYVLNEKPVLEVLNEYLEMDAICFYTLKKYLKKFDSEKEKMFQYIMQYYTERIKALNTVPCEEDVKKKIKMYCHCILNVAQNCDKTEDDLPEIVLTQIKQNWKEFQYHKLLCKTTTFSSRDIRQYLKTDPTLVVTQFPEIKNYCEKTRMNINWLIQKLKVYFSHDISDKYLQIFNEYLSSESHHYFTVEIVVRGILVLADWTHKIEFLEKYSPISKTIDRAKTSSNTLEIQRAICRQMLCSRPPLPLEKVFKYVTGDYVKHCLFIFRSFMVNLPQTQSLEFIQKLINSPVSIQKHGLRLAFDCVEMDKLPQLILDSWNKTKNVSLRMVLYGQLSTKVSSERGDTQLKLFDILMTLTSNLNEDDEEPLKQTGSVRLPDHLIGRYYEAVWNTVSKFSKKSLNVAFMTRILHRIDQNLSLVPVNCVDKIVNDYIHFLLIEENILKTKNGVDILLDAKWNLTISSLTNMTNDNQFDKNVKLTKQIIMKFIEMWNKLDENGTKYIVRHFTKRFVTDLGTKSNYDRKSYSNFVALMKIIEEDLKAALPEKEIYLLVWHIRSNIVCKTVVLESEICMENFGVDDIKELGIRLGNDFGMLIKRSVEEGTFYRMFCGEIEGIVTNNFYNCCRNIHRLCFSPTDLVILLCLGLLEQDIFETCIIALNILPSEYEGIFLDLYLSAIKKIQALQSKELQFYAYEKFVNKDFKKRSYIN